MSRTITIDPLTRIEGHGRITIHLDDQGFVADARFQVTQLRGFEKLVEGRPFYEMPALMARICGICPVSHLIASAKACDAIMAVRIPDPAMKLRRMMNLAQILQSHALNLFHLSSPDLLLGMDADPARRNLFALAESHPQLVRDGIRLRAIGQQIIELLGGKRVHPAWVVPGGMSAPLSVEQRDRILAMLPEALTIAMRTVDLFKGFLAAFPEEARAFGNFPTLFMGLVDDRGGLEHYDGAIRVVDAAGARVVDRAEPQRYQELIGEAVEPWSFLKFPYYLPKGYPEGIYRVGPLARLNIVDTAVTQWADQELAEFRQLGHATVLSSFHYHHARLVEILFAVERIEQLLNEPDILSRHVRAEAAPNAAEGIGVSEAPRGLLIHHYRVDEHGLVTFANLIIATGHNNLAMNRAVLQVAKRFVKGERIEEGMLNRVEAVIRAFDPCLSCSTHAAGRMPLVIELLGPGGERLDTVRRESA
jgi:NAD-reducing hydrogenase large subunit